MPYLIPTYHDLVERWKRLRARGMSVREVACVGAARTLLCVDLGDVAAPQIHISAGVHGDEPAGVLALLELLENDGLPRRFTYRLWPCLNPSGFDAGTRTNDCGIDINRTFGRGGGSPEAKAVVMANRDRKFSLALDLHEDDECPSPYAYTYGARTLLDGDIPVLEPDPEREAAELGGLSLTLLLVRNATSRAVTLESCATKELGGRVAWHVNTVRSIVGRL